MIYKILSTLKLIIMIISGITLCVSIVICITLACDNTNSVILEKYTMPTKKVELHDASYKPRTYGDSKIKDGYILTALSKDNEEYTVFMPAKPNIDKAQRISIFTKSDTANLSNEQYYAFENKKDFENSKREITTTQNAITKVNVIATILIIFSIIVLLVFMNIH